MTRREFLNARNAYLIAKAALDTAKEDEQRAEREFMARKGYEGEYIWTVDLDETAFDALLEDYERECAAELAAVTAAEKLYNESAARLADLAASVAPLPAAELTAFKHSAHTNAATREKVIEIALKLDARTIPAKM